MIHLLDTPAAFALAAEPEAVPWRTREALAEPGTTVAVSAASVWEAAELAVSGRLRFDRPVEVWFRDVCQAYSWSLLDVGAVHGAHVAKLPHGGDPFDRIIAAQALVEGALVVSPDAAMAKLPVRVLW